MKQDFEYAVAFPARDAMSQGLCPSLYKQYAAFREVYEAASDCIGEDLYRLSYEDSALRPELHTLLLITHCYATYRVFRQYFHRPAAAIGFSQGEFTAAAAAESIGFVEALRLVYELERLLADSPAIKGGYMARVVELKREKLLECCRRVDPSGSSVAVAICLSEEQNVISGRKREMNEVSILARETGARWVIPLKSGGAFHSPLCTAILEESDPVFDRCSFVDPKYDIYSCTDGKCSRNGKAVKEKLSRQIAMPIAWDTIINDLRDRNIKYLFELGPGCTVSGNSRIICQDITYMWINHAGDMEEAIRLMEKRP